MFDKGTIFIDKKASSYQGVKPKYFIGLNDADIEDDKIVCFVFNTEYSLQNLKEGCNKEKEKFYLLPNTFTFLPNHTVMLLRNFRSFSEVRSKLEVKSKDFGKQKLPKSI